MDRSVRPTRDTVDTSLGFLLNDVSRLLRRLFDQHARGLGFTRAQWRVLVHLERNEGISQSGLAEIIEVQNITLGRLIDRLEKSDWVERRADPDDRRVRRLYLTRAAQPVLARMHELAAVVHDQALASLSGAERSVLAAGLTRVKANLALQLDPEGHGGDAHPAQVMGGRHAR
ncbi:MAG: MarR family transcriptional regulator [Alphaproteobacteria bacterium]|nr:MarR family transcriptional regulator [Alphaproteobacteria bacterium]